MVYLGKIYKKKLNNGIEQNEKRNFLPSLIHSVCFSDKLLKVKGFSDYYQHSSWFKHLVQYTDPQVMGPCPGYPFFGRL